MSFWDGFSRGYILAWVLLAMAVLGLVSVVIASVTLHALGGC